MDQGRISATKKFTSRRVGGSCLIRTVSALQPPGLEYITVLLVRNNGPALYHSTSAGPCDQSLFVIRRQTHRLPKLEELSAWHQQGTMLSPSIPGCPVVDPLLSTVSRRLHSLIKSRHGRQASQTTFSDTRADEVPTGFQEPSRYPSPLDPWLT